MKIVNLQSAIGNLLILCVICVICGSGCSSGEIQDQLKLQRLTQEKVVSVDAIQHDPNLTKAEKTKATAMEVVGYMKDSGVLKPEDESPFLDYVEWAWNAYMLWYPDKSTVGMLSIVIALGVSWLNSRKKTNAQA